MIVMNAVVFIAGWCFAEAWNAVEFRGEIMRICFRGLNKTRERPMLARYGDISAIDVYLLETLLKRIFKYSSIRTNGDVCIGETIGDVGCARDELELRGETISFERTDSDPHVWFIVIYGWSETQY